jgi:hypothetical protein
MNIQNIIAGIPALFASLGAEAVQLGDGLVTFLETAGPSGFVVATDVLTDIAQKGVTPLEATQQLQDITTFNAAAAGAIKTIQASNLAATAETGAASAVAFKTVLA